MQYHQPNVVSRSALLHQKGSIAGVAAYIVEDVEVLSQGVASGCCGAIVGDLDSVVERVQVDALKDDHCDGS